MNRRIWIYVCVGITAVLTSLFLTKNVDLSVYWFGVNGFFAGAKPMYGPGSGLGFPMEYRYPPVTYLLLFPLKWVSLRVAGFWWMLAAWITATFTVSLAIRIRHLRFNRSSILACCAFLLSYIVLAIRYGNVQPFVIAWIFVALLLSETYPLAAGILLSLAVTFKIWPVMFLPWFFHRRRVRSVAYFVLSLLTLWILPVPIFGATGYWRQLQDWYSAVARVGTTYSEFYYFPGQSLRGLLLRYFTPVVPALKSFPVIHVLSLPPHAAVVAWMILSIGIYGFFAICMLRSDPRKLWAWDGLAFVLYSLLEPYAVKSGLISVGPAALTAACLFTLSNRDHGSRLAAWANRLFIAACLISFGTTLLQYLPWQRFLLTIGVDFWAEVLLLAALFIWIVFTPLPEILSEPRSGHRASLPCDRQTRPLRDCA